MVVDGDNKPTKVGKRIEGTGDEARSVRFARRSGKEL
jgi:hypothetical protein